MGTATGPSAENVRGLHDKVVAVHNALRGIFYFLSRTPTDDPGVARDHSEIGLKLIESLEQNIAVFPKGGIIEDPFSVARVTFSSEKSLRTSTSVHDAIVRIGWRVFIDLADSPIRLGNLEVHVSTSVSTTLDGKWKSVYADGRVTFERRTICFELPVFDASLEDVIEYRSVRPVSSLVWNERTEAWPFDGGNTEQAIKDLKSLFLVDEPVANLLKHEKKKLLSQLGHGRDEVTLEDLEALITKWKAGTLGKRDFVALLEKAPPDAIGDPTLTGGWVHVDGGVLSHTPDYSNVFLRGKEYFVPRSARVILEYMILQWKLRITKVHINDIFEKSGLPKGQATGSLRDKFKGSANKTWPIYKALFSTVPGQRGFWKLNLGSTKLEPSGDNSASIP